MAHPIPTFTTLQTQEGQLESGFMCVNSQGFPRDPLREDSTCSHVSTGTHRCFASYMRRVAGSVAMVRPTQCDNSSILVILGVYNKSYMLGGLKQQTIISHSSRFWNSRTELQHGVLLVRAFFWVADFLLYLTSSLSFAYKNTNLIHKGTTPVTKSPPNDSTSNLRFRL